MYKHVRALAIEEEFYFQWHITERCNWKCKHCYQSEEASHDLPLKDLLRIARIIEEATLKWARPRAYHLREGSPF